MTMRKNTSILYELLPVYSRTYHIQTIHMLDSIVIIPLAGFNDDKGKLSLLSIQRLEKCVQIGRNYKNSKIVLPGGVGQHFNPTNLPHFSIQEEYLSSQLGWSRDAIGKGFTGSENQSIRMLVGLY